MFFYVHTSAQCNNPTLRGMAYPVELFESKCFLTTLNSVHLVCVFLTDAQGLKVT